MPVRLSSFRAFAGTLRTHKEEIEGGEEDAAVREMDEEDAKRFFEDVKAKEAKIDEALVKQCIRVRKGDLEHASVLLESMIDFRKAEGWPLKLAEDDIDRDVLASGAHELSRSPEGRAMLVMHCGRVDVDKVAPTKAFQQHAQYLLEKVSLDDEETQVHGVALEIDFTDAGFSLLRHFNRHDLQRGVNIFRKFPIKLKRVYIAHASWAVRFTIKSVLRFSSESVRSKVVFH